MFFYYYMAKKYFRNDGKHLIDRPADRPIDQQKDKLTDTDQKANYRDASTHLKRNEKEKKESEEDMK
jgi:hypothetical protein